MNVITLPVNFVDIRNIPINIHDIENNIRQFYICLDIGEDEDFKSQCLDARGYLERARLLLRNLISIEENEYIVPWNKAYIFMQENLGRVDKRMNEVEMENIDQLFIHDRLQRREIRESPMLRRYINSLVTCMEHLVFYPLRNALEKFREDYKNEDGEKVKKTKNLYLYFLFLELLHSSESLGALTAEKKSGKVTMMSSNQTPASNSSKYSQEDSPSSLPKDVETEEVVNEDIGIGHSAEEFFKEGSSEETLFEDDDMEITEENSDEEGLDEQ